MLSGCSGRLYKDQSFLSQANLSNQKVAVVPVEVNLTGNFPKTWTADKIAMMKKEGSVRYQEEIYQDFLLKSKSRPVKKKWKVELMDVQEVNQRLAKNNVSVEDSWKMTSRELAEILGTAMIVRGKIQTHRNMSEGAAAGINAGAAILESLLSKDADNVSGSRVVRANKSNIRLSLYHHDKSEPIAWLDDSWSVNRLPVYISN